MNFGSLFTGIGGFDLGFERAGLTCSWQVEIDDYCNRVLTKHWPNVPRYRDVHDCGAHNLAAIDLICGGFPCQPHSVAGKRRGSADDRDLWPEMRRIIDELRPTWVVAENVPGIRTTILDAVLTDLESLDYAVGALSVPAAAFDAPHIRQRIFILAYTNRCQQGRGQQPQQGSYRRDANITGDGAQGNARLLSNPQRINDKRSMVESEAKLTTTAGTGWWAIEPELGRVAYGVPHRVDRLRSLGNAVVPQMAEWIARRIVEAA